MTRSFWALTVSSDNRRLGLFSRQPDGTWRVEEDPYRRLNRFRIFLQHSEPNGDVWITGEKLLRFSPGMNAAAPQPFPTVVRQVNAGPRVVFGGANVAGTSDLRLPPGSNALRFQFAALTYGNPAETEYQYFLEGADKDWSTLGQAERSELQRPGPGGLSVPRALAHGRRPHGRRRDLLLHDPPAVVPDHAGLCALRSAVAAAGSRGMAAHQQA